MGLTTNKETNHLMPRIQDIHVRLMGVIKTNVKHDQLEMIVITATIVDPEAIERIIPTLATDTETIEMTCHPEGGKIVRTKGKIVRVNDLIENTALHQVEHTNGMIQVPIKDCGEANLPTAALGVLLNTHEILIKSTIIDIVDIINLKGF